MLSNNRERVMAMRMEHLQSKAKVDHALKAKRERAMNTVSVEKEAKMKEAKEMEKVRKHEEKLKAEQVPWPPSAPATRFSSPLELRG